MKVSVRTIQKTAFTVEMPETGEDATVAGLKRAIEKDQGESSFPAAHTKLIYKGQVLQDASTLADAGVSETGFVVAMVKLPKAPKASSSSAASGAPSTAPPAPASSETPTAAAAGGPEAQGGASGEGSTSAPAAAAAASGGATTAASAAETLVSGEERERSVNELMSLGFDKEKVQQALRAAFNNPDRAADYLLNGIPASAAVPPPQAPPQVQGVAQGAATTGTESTQGGPNTAPLNLFPSGGAGGGGGGDPNARGPLAALRQSPQLSVLRALAQSNPAYLQPTLAELGRHNPRLLQLINNNQEEFLRIMNEPLTEEEMASLEPIFGSGRSEDLPGERGAEVPPIEVSAEEEAAIQRLMTLGFDRAAVIEAYFACEKNEDAAANFLFDSSG